MRTVVGLFETRDAAEDAIRRLQAAGYGQDRIGVAMRDTRTAGDIAAATGASDMSEEGATVGAVAGAGVGALVGLALVGSTIVLPGLGPLLVGGALAAGLTGAGIGAASGGLIGGLIGAGIPEAEAQDYASRLRHGHILVTVRVPEAEVHRARDILTEDGVHSS
ncbi:MAG TPA: general stress protein [Isosphaeraceae bacterium]